MIKAFVFDVYGTLFDVHSVQEECETHFPGKGDQISQVWRAKQLEYFFIRQISGRYEDFSIVTRDALRYALMVADVTASVETENELISAYAKLAPYEEVENVLKQLKDRHTVVLSNGTEKMLNQLIGHASFGSLFDELVSIDGAKQFKPSPSAYMYWFKTMDLKRDEVLFMSSNGWDIVGAKNFGFQTAWINRDDKPIEALDVRPDAVYDDLTGILEWC